MSNSPLEPFDGPLPTCIVSEQCVRCMRPFRNGEDTYVVRGGPSAKYRAVAIHVCKSCQFDASLDEPIAMTIFTKTRSGPPSAPTVAGQKGVGFAKVNYLENGQWRIGLHRGHVEVYSAKERQEYLNAYGNNGVGSYSPDYAVYAAGPKEARSGWIGVVRSEFLDLSRPTQTGHAEKPKVLGVSDRPWMFALEMQLAALRFTNAVLASGNPRLEKHRTLHKQAADSLIHAETFAWSNETVSAVSMASRTIPADTELTPSTFLLSPDSWWWLENATPYVSNKGTFTDEEAAIYALLLSRVTRQSDGVDGLAIMTFGMLDGKAPFVSTGWFWPFGTSLGQLERESLEMARSQGEVDKDGFHLSDQTSLHIRHLSRFVCAALSWLNQRILVSSLGHVERHRRKQLTREHNVPLPSDVKVIQLRRTESSSSRSAGEGESPADWSCRWIVNGHWRNQPYKDERRLIYIMPYVKGPEDKPLKVPSHTVYQVSR